MISELSTVQAPLPGGPLKMTSYLCSQMDTRHLGTAFRVSQQG